MRLHRAAVERRLVGPSEEDRLLFCAAAEHALRITRRDGGDPCRLFAAIVNRGQLLFVTQADEERARRRLKRDLYGECRRRRTPLEEALAED